VGGKPSWSDRPDRDIGRDAKQCTGVLNANPRGTATVARYLNGNGQMQAQTSPRTPDSRVAECDDCQRLC
jgi:hypothetical protein